ncbi:MAG: hypothetical protein IIW66_04420 [Bacteroidales bacterium]|nr:hypothetical protein [Bacteroidales bacterium]MBQ5864618.1 hypothetical protein [Bacteroidales bacterium]
MDFSLVCSEIQELLINNESVILPGIGKLVIENQSATFLQDGLTIAPPSKKLQFIPQGNLVQEGKNTSNIAQLSGRILERLATHGEFAVPGLGIFSKKGDSPITFTADPDFNFSPDNFALEAIALEAIAPETKETGETEKPAESPKTNPAPVEKAPAAHKSDVEHKKDCRRKWLMGAILVIVLVAVMVLFAILFKDDVMPLLQKILYTEEELQIIQKWAAQ